MRICLAPVADPVSASWFDASPDVDEVRGQFDDVRRRFNVEEVWVVDVDCCGPEVYKALSDCSDPAFVARIAEHYYAHHDIFEAALAISDDVEEAEAALERFVVAELTEKECAESYLDSTGLWDECPEHLRPFIDTECYAFNLRVNGFHFVRVNDFVYLFHP